MEELMQQAQAGEIDSVYVALPLSSERRIEEVVNQLADSTASVYVVPDLFVSGTGAFTLGGFWVCRL